jgi:hypothetical protein
MLTTNNKYIKMEKRCNWDECANLTQIFSFLNFSELYPVAFLVSKTWKRISNGKVIWKMLFSTHFSHLNIDIDIDNGIDIELFKQVWNSSTRCRIKNCEYFGSKQTWHYCSNHFALVATSDIKKVSKTWSLSSSVREVMMKSALNIKIDHIHTLKILGSVTMMDISIWLQLIHKYFSTKFILSADFESLITSAVNIIEPETIFTRNAIYERLLMILRPYVIGSLGGGKCLHLHAEGLSLDCKVERVLCNLLKEEKIEVKPSERGDCVEQILQMVLKVHEHYMIKYGPTLFPAKDYFWDMSFSFNTESGPVLK